MRLAVIAFLVSLTLWALGGCQRALVPVATPLEIDRSEYTPMYLASIEVLRDHGLLIDRQDHRFGIVTAHPQPSPVMLEVWRPDNTTAYQAVTSTLHQQRRKVTVLLEPPTTGPDAAMPQLDDQGAWPGYDIYYLRVEVILEQLQVPTHYLTGSSSGYRIMGRLRQVPGELQERGIHGPFWQPVGRDPYMEQRLAAQIVRRSLAMDAQTVEPAQPPLIDVTLPPPLEGLD